MLAITYKEAIDMGFKQVEPHKFYLNGVTGNESNGVIEINLFQDMPEVMLEELLEIKKKQLKYLQSRDIPSGFCR
jgi:dihydroorotase